MKKRKTNYPTKMLITVVAIVFALFGQVFQSEQLSVFAQQYIQSGNHSAQVLESNQFNIDDIQLNSLEPSQTYLGTVSIDPSSFGANDFVPFGGGVGGDAGNSSNIGFGEACGDGGVIGIGGACGGIGGDGGNGNDGRFGGGIGGPAGNGADIGFGGGIGGDGGNGNDGRFGGGIGGDGGNGNDGRFGGGIGGPAGNGADIGFGGGIGGPAGNGADIGFGGGIGGDGGNGNDGRFGVVGGGNASNGGFGGVGGGGGSNGGFGVVGGGNASNGGFGGVGGGGGSNGFVQLRPFTLWDKLVNTTMAYINPYGLSDKSIVFIYEIENIEEVQDTLSQITAALQYEQLAGGWYVGAVVTRDSADGAYQEWAPVRYDSSVASEILANVERFASNLPIPGENRTDAYWVPYEELSNLVAQQRSDPTSATD